MFTRELKAADSDGARTQERLLEAAGQIFADVGYRAATVRQICQKAGANVAAVNYYFGDKEGLYLAVLRSVPRAHAEKYPPVRNRELSARERLRVRRPLRARPLPVTPRSQHRVATARCHAPALMNSGVGRRHRPATTSNQGALIATARWLLSNLPLVCRVGE